MAEKHAAQVISIKEASARVKAERAARLRAARQAANRSWGRKRDTDPRWLALLRLMVVMALVIGGLLLVRELRSVSKLQDCVMEGRTNCAPIDARSVHRTH